MVVLSRFCSDVPILPSSYKFLTELMAGKITSRIKRFTVPPYQPVSETANFTSYTNKNFTFEDLSRLSELCMKLDSKGCRVLLSNSDSKEVADLFSKKPWKVRKIQANRSINSNSKKRTGHFELLIKNY